MVSISVRSAEIAGGSSLPVRPSEPAAMKRHGVAASTTDTSMRRPSSSPIVSATWPVGSSLPVLAPMVPL